jgi:hypothetical protein
MYQYRYCAGRKRGEEGVVKKIIFCMRICDIILAVRGEI